MVKEFHISDNGYSLGKQGGKYSAKNAGGTFSPSRRIIGLNKSIGSMKELRQAIAHELGHASDFFMGGDDYASTKGVKGFADIGRGIGRKNWLTDLFHGSNHQQSDEYRYGP